jgi:CO/xanthine dehydrogenase Mo-binding subunit
VFEVTVIMQTGKISVPRVTVAMDAGLVINPNALESQVEGAVTMGISEAFEAVRFNRQTITSRDWVTYPIMRFVDAPEEIKIALISRPDQSSTGGGEPPHKPVLAGVSNAVFDATGVRLRHLPFNPTRVRAELKAAGVA